MKTSLCSQTTEMFPTTDREVSINYFRAKTAEVLKNANILADDNALERARELLNGHLSELQTSAPISHEAIAILIRDTRDGLNRMVDSSAYAYSGKAYFKSKARNHMMQQSSHTDTLYSNTVQKSMIQRSKVYKKAH